jgi:hypothetical protein
MFLSQTSSFLEFFGTSLYEERRSLQLTSVCMYLPAKSETLPRYNFVKIFVVNFLNKKLEQILEIRDFSRNFEGGSLAKATVLASKLHEIWCRMASS